MPIGFKIIPEEIDRKLILRIEGRLDASSSPILEKKVQQMMDELHNYIILDFSSVDYLSSAGLRVLLSATKKLKSNKGDLILFSVDEDLMEIIRMAGFDKILRICSNENDALQIVPHYR